LNQETNAAKKNDSVWFSVQILSITGGCIRYIVFDGGRALSIYEKSPQGQKIAGESLPKFAR
jgi:hypothetical protein